MVRKEGVSTQVPSTVPFVQRELSARLHKIPEERKKEVDTHPVDFLEKFLRSKDAYPDIVGSKTVLGLTLSMVNAGSGTISKALFAEVYYLLKNPETMSKLLGELDGHFPPPSKDKEFSEENIVPFSGAQKPPYLDVCLKETFRIHPSLGGQLMERVVPPGGAFIAGESIPGGTIVSGNPWTVQRHRSSAYIWR